MIEFLWSPIFDFIEVAPVRRSFLRRQRRNRLVSHARRLGRTSRRGRGCRRPARPQSADACPTGASCRLSQAVTSRRAARRPANHHAEPCWSWPGRAPAGESAVRSRGGPLRGDGLFVNDLPVVPLVGPSWKVTTAFRGRRWIRGRRRRGQGAGRVTRRLFSTTQQPCSFRLCRRLRN